MILLVVPGVTKDGRQKSADHFTVNTHVKETGFSHLGSEFLNRNHNLHQGKR